MTSFENIYYTKEYQSQRNDYLSGIIVPENKGETEKIPLDAGFFLLSTDYILKKQGNISKTAYEQSLLSPDGTKLHSWQIADSHDFTDFSAIFAHSDSRLYFIYKEDLYGYSVLRLNAQDGRTITVVGTIPLPVAGERLVVTGRWSNHTAYGKQFEAEFLERLLPETTPEILSYLSSRSVKGIGPKLAARIVSRFGTQTLSIIEREPWRLAEVSGISQAKAKEIGLAFRQQVGLRRLIEFLTLHHLPAELAVQLYKQYGEDAV